MRERALPPPCAGARRFASCAGPGAHPRRLLAAVQASWRAAVGEAIAEAAWPRAGKSRRGDHGRMPRADLGLQGSSESYLQDECLLELSITASWASQG